MTGGILTQPWVASLDLDHHSVIAIQGNREEQGVGALGSDLVLSRSRGYIAALQHCSIAVLLQQLASGSLLEVVGRAL